MNLILSIFLFILGCLVGSFLNVVIIRSAKNQDFVKGRSKCTKCHKIIAWYDNIPLLSYIFLRGKCRNCDKKISIQYPIVEFLTGVMFVWWYLVGFTIFSLATTPLQIIQPLFWLFIGILLLIIIVADWQYMIIPDFAVILIATATIAYKWYLSTQGAMQWVDFYQSLYSGIGVMFVFLLIFIFTQGKGMGFGDVKYVFAMGLLLSWPNAFIATFIAFTSGAIFGITLLALKRLQFSQKIAFGPFLVFGTIVALLWGDEIWKYYMTLLSI